MKPPHAPHALALLPLAVLACCSALAQPAYDPARYDVRPLLGGTEDEVIVPVRVAACPFRYLHDPPFTVTHLDPGPTSGLDGHVHVTLDLERIPGSGCGDWEVGQDVIGGVRIGTLPAGVHRITWESRGFEEGASEPFLTRSDEHYITILRNSRFESGFWFDPDNPGHGMSLIVRSGRTREQYDENGDPAGYVMPQSLYFSWQTYDAEGRPLWLVGALPDGEARPLRADVYRHEGMRYPSLESADLQGERWGEAIITPVACGRLDVTWRPAAPGLAERTIQFQRLVGTEEVPYCEPHPSWLTVPARLAEP